MDIQQAINLELHRQFNQQGIAFAYPTRTIYLGAPVPAALPRAEEADRPQAAGRR
jgi:small-conductance mechanosensitive channel